MLRHTTPHRYTERRCQACLGAMRFSCLPEKRSLKRRSVQTLAVLGSPQGQSKLTPPPQHGSSNGHEHPGLRRESQTIIARDAASELFPNMHAQGKDISFYAYFPIGCAVAGVRMVMWLMLLFLDQAWLTNNDLSIAVLQAILGVRVRWDNLARLPKGRTVIVSNHVTTGDMMALYRLPRRTIHLISSQLPDRIAQSRHHRIDFRHASVESYDRLNEEEDDSPIHLFPEGGMTNGVGMMKFNKGFMRFSEGLPVSPVALRANLPWGISTHTLTSSFLSNLFWFCFSPYVDLRMTVLPAVSRQKGESKAGFVERIQQQIANDLKIPIFDFTLQAKKQLIRDSRKSR